MKPRQTLLLVAGGSALALLGWWLSTRREAAGAASDGGQAEAQEELDLYSRLASETRIPSGVHRWWQTVFFAADEHRPPQISRSSGEMRK